MVDIDVTSQNYDTNDNDLVLTPNDSLTLRCSGNAPLTWLRNGRQASDIFLINHFLRLSLYEFHGLKIVFNI